MNQNPEVPIMIQMQSSAVVNETMENHQPAKKKWSSPFPSLPINNEHGVVQQNEQKKAIFNDLLKVPYDVLNAPPDQPVPKPEIHINHQQKFNDTITSNYQHFQQFIHKNLNKPNTMSYQSTPQPEQNYEVDESVSVMTNGRAHGIQPQSTTPRINPLQAPQQHGNIPEQLGGGEILPSHDVPHDEQDAKFGYVVEGRNFRKYRVEEKTADGFIVG